MDHSTPPPPKRDTAAPPPSAPRLSLTDFVDLGTLQEIQDAFASVTRLSTTILDADGQPATLPTDAAKRHQSDLVFEQLIDIDDPATEGTVSETGAKQFQAPITVEGQTLGSIIIEPAGPSTDELAPDLHELEGLADALNLDEVQRQELIDSAELAFGTNRGAAIQFLYLMANAIARLCFEQYHAQQRLEELSVLYRVSTVLAGREDLQQTLDTAARAVADLVKVRAVVIRILKDTEDGPILERRANTGLSDDYINKGKLLVNRSEMLAAALRGETIYIRDMATDPRVYFPEQAREENLASMLCVGIIYQGQAIGTLQLFTDEVRQFTQFDIDLVRAIAQLLAAAIENTRLDEARSENQKMLRQLHLAADVQRRMLPRKMPDVPGYDIAARYVPSFELSGDFYDFINLDHSLGIGVGDVVGKGVAASLLMASVRSSLRAYAQDLYDLDEVISRVNKHMCRDTLESEFVTLWYGTLDRDSGRLTYCNAGHEAPLIVRNGELIPLDIGGMIVGVDRDQAYDKGVWDFQPGDMLLLYTDGLPDAMNAQGERFGRQRTEELLLSVADKPANDALNDILWTVRQFTGPRRATDDTTLIVIKAE
ncbi:SpoIIE family protein phosphatase [Algisphaera agarilytica]|uniref:Serine phosphatase RsbU (Regulator of sigma subunit) n=1 Tax=Algisphaera agarilytica TaxID=1385975 RepID=A0A7X0LL24_9BACT|nr:SpoIIE family protein phosphatase [Algisphaera agarilytica]MBB6429543.1 serine phosphatase RsbU (regulator of sigma subunit) [Algisphaera agarilytica]